MNCGKCHGWMEHRFHPQIYKPKGGSKNVVKKEDYIEKKLVNPVKKEKESNLECVINKEVDINKAIFSVGAPFFKN